MSAKDEILEYLWQESTVDIHRVAKAIAEAQLEAVERYLEFDREDYTPMQGRGSQSKSGAYLASLRKDAGK